ncbi:MAG: alpha/beta hydrolase [Corynebacterium sp.]|nr:alpha/beta hydrolase [Corynebacterium sp.]
MVFARVAKKFRDWRIARNTRGQEFKPPQFSQGHRVGKLRYYTEGDENAPVTLVFIHGYTLAAQAWHMQIAALADQARCIAMDLRGHGKSDVCPIAEYTIDGAADDVMTVLDDAHITTPIILIGHSLGGMVLLNFLHRYPQFRLLCKGIVLVSTSAQPFAAEGVTKLLKLPIVNSIRDMAEANLEEAQGVRTAVSELVVPMVEATAALADEEKMRHLHMQLIDNTPLSSVIGFLDDLQEQDETAALQYLQDVPGRVLVGADDVFTPVTSSQYIVNHWPAATLTVVPDTGHMLPLENPTVVNAAIMNLLTEVATKKAVDVAD